MTADSSEPTGLSPTDRTRLRREKTRAGTERDELFDVLRAGMFCHLGVVVDGAPMVLPTAYGLDLSPTAVDAPDGTLYLHGSVAARSLSAAPDQTICVTVTHVDGLVLARSGFHHSVNYRSAVIFGRPRWVTDPDERLHALRAVTEQLVPGRWDAVRPPSRKELVATGLIALPLTEASVKRRSGDPIDEPEDVELPIWAGVLPMRVVADEPVTAANTPPGLDVPAHVSSHRLLPEPIHPTD